MDTSRQVLDHSALKFNQISIITLALLGFILNQPILPSFVAAVLIAGSLNSNFALFKLTYKHVIKPLKLLKPNPIEDISTPHEFAQLLGGIVLGIGSLLLYTGSPLLGWIFTWIVIALAAANLIFGFCAGCFVYYQLKKLGVPGFRIPSQ
ncbi:MAG: DUF4395 domain-containing protein [Ignavibacteriales bacterium]|nr:DUF4395 domain-containing protein [Ignavibacteriales bacterium]